MAPDTMQAAIDWGYNMLDGPRQRLLAELSLFADRFDRTRPRAVHGSNALDPLTQLAERSTVEYDTRHYRLIETIREYATGQPGHSGLRVSWTCLGPPRTAASRAPTPRTPALRAVFP